VVEVVRDGEDEVGPRGQRGRAQHLLQGDQVVQTGFLLKIWYARDYAGELTSATATVFFHLSGLPGWCNNKKAVVVPPKEPKPNQLQLMLLVFSRMTLLLASVN
jgi:hypothetical protein